MAKFILSAFADEIGPDFNLQMNELDRHGIKHIEVRGVDGASISDYTVDMAKALKKRMDERGFTASALGTPCGKQKITDEFGPHLDMFKRMLDVADTLEAPYLRMFSFFIEEGKAAEYKAEVMKRLEAFVRAAEGRRVRLVHENEKHIYGDIGSRCLEIVKAFPSIKATFDPSNFVQCDEDNKKTYEMLRPYIVYMHIKDSVYSGEKAAAVTGIDLTSDSHRPAGMGQGDVEWVLRNLWNSGYEGFLSIEPHLARFTGAPEGGPEKFAIAATALKVLLHSVTGNLY